MMPALNRSEEQFGEQISHYREAYVLPKENVDNSRRYGKWGIASGVLATGSTVILSTLSEDTTSAVRGVFFVVIGLSAMGSLICHSVSRANLSGGNLIPDSILTALKSTSSYASSFFRQQPLEGDAAESV